MLCCVTETRVPLSFSTKHICISLPSCVLREGVEQLSITLLFRPHLKKRGTEVNSYWTKVLEPEEVAPQLSWHAWPAAEVFFA